MEYELYHYGILGMHWGIRRYQNKDGTWTSAGKRRYGSDGSIIGDRKRIKRATDAAEIGKRIESLQSKKKISQKTSAQIDKLSKVRQSLIKDLDSREIEYGERKINKYVYLRSGMQRLEAAGISADGRRALLAARRIKYFMSDEGKKTRQLKKDLKRLRSEAKKANK